MKKWLLRRMSTENVKRLRAIRRLPSLFSSSFRDLSRHARYSAYLGIEGDLEKHRGLITATFHNLEKGLSLPLPRPGFGESVAKQLIELMELYFEEYSVDDFSLVPISVLRSYLNFQRSNGMILSNIEESVLSLETKFSLFQATPSNVMAGTKLVSRASTLDLVNSGPRTFMLSRSSVRQFLQMPLRDDAVRRAVHVAQKSPGVCNRQSGRVRQILGRKNIDQVLALQGGARGFGENVPALFCLSVDVRNFNGVGERYQGWIDGGLFAMSFILGLHAEGIGTCCLNWSKDHVVDKKMHSLLGLPEHEMIIMFLAAGELLEEFVVAVSTRRPIDEVFETIGVLNLERNVVDGTS